MASETLPVERYLLGHAGKDAHAGYGKQWIETLKAAIEIIPNPLQAPLQDRARSISPDSVTVRDGFGRGAG